MTTNFEDVKAFHEKYDLPTPASPVVPEKDLLQFRSAFMAEELAEFNLAASCGDVAGMADALVDLVYVTMGTAVSMGLPWQELWDEVQRANMSKVRALSAADSKRGSTYDVVKPFDWQPPRIVDIINRAAAR